MMDRALRAAQHLHRKKFGGNIVAPQCPTIHIADEVKRAAANKAVARPTLAETFRKVPNAGNFSVTRIAWVVEKEMARPKGFEPLIPRFRGRAERYLSL
jgi:hypothetical protein